ncbi:hypothetical protein NBRC10513v2_007308 [Rhodotorula toruloides]
MLAGGVVVGAAYWLDGRIGGRVHPILVATGKLEEMTAHLEEQSDYHTKQNDAVLSALASLKADIAVLMDRTDRKAEEEVENYAQEALQA